MEFSEAKIYHYKIKESLDGEEVEDFMDKKGHRLKDCEWMFGNIEMIDNE